MRNVFMIVGCVALAGCAPRHGPREAATAPRTCIVLSSGGLKTLFAEVGALETLQESGEKVDCLVSTGVGALAGGLYASTRGGGINEKIQTLVSHYRGKSRGEFLGSLLLGFGGLLLGDPTAIDVAASALSYERPATLDFERTVRSLNETFGETKVGELRVEFVTLRLRLRSEVAELEENREGKLADAIAASMASPILFRELPGRTVDAGLIPELRTPISDACRLFPRARLIAIRFGKKVPLPRTACDVIDVAIKDPLENSRGWVGVEVHRWAGRVRVGRVVEGSPAFAAGMREDDVIRQIAGGKVSEPAEALREIAKRPGQSITFALSRRGEDLSIPVVAEARTAQLEFGEGFAEQAAELNRAGLTAASAALDAR